MAPASIASSAGRSRLSGDVTDSARYPGWPEEASSLTVSKMMRDGAYNDSTSDCLRQAQESKQTHDQLETPTRKREYKSPIQMRPSAEKYNRHSKVRIPRSPAVPEDQLNTSKLATAFPGFSGVADDIKPLSPNPFLNAKQNTQVPEIGHKLKVPSWAQPRQPKIQNENEDPKASEVRPSAAAGIANKNTRFGGINVPKTRKGLQPHMYKPAPGLVQNAAAAATVTTSKPMAINAQGSLTSLPISSTQQTLNLPHGTNLTDIFSGVVRHPPPVVSQQARPRASRFASASKVQAATEPVPEQIPVPYDERDLLRSIEVLQAKVVELELVRNQLEATNTQLDQKNFDLAVENREFTARRRSDSAVGLTDSGNEKNNAGEKDDESSTARRKLVEEHKRYRSTCWALQGQQDILLREIELSKKDILDITEERDQYMAQLSAAESDIQHYRAEKAHLEQQRAQTVGQLTLANSNIDKLVVDNESLADENKRLKAQIVLLQQMSTAQNAIAPQHSGLGDSDADDEEGPRDMDTISMMNQQQKAQQAARHNVQATFDHHKTHSLDSSHNITYLSKAADSSLCRVRKNLEYERIARHDRRQAKAPENSFVAPAVKPKAAASPVPTGEPRNYSESSTGTTRHRRSNIPQEEMTSGFIIPDITLNQKQLVGSQSALQLPVQTQSQPEIPSKPEEIRDVSQQQPQDHFIPSDVHVQPVRQTTARPQLPAISDEELDITIGSDADPTPRPSQSPDEAFTAVVDSILTELASQKAQLAKYQNAYDRQDATLSQKQRKQIFAKREALQRSIDMKADQLYNLKDVSEGQKQRDQSLTHEQVNDTLHSLGLELPWAGLPSSTDSRRRSTVSSRSL
ncbi:MAG: hypothetical protein Q9220_006093 [cf. Caloplaca sp. 1 TL-2023]